MNLFPAALSLIKHALPETILCKFGRICATGNAFVRLMPIRKINIFQGNRSERGGARRAPMKRDLPIIDQEKSGESFPLNQMLVHLFKKSTIFNRFVVHMRGKKMTLPTEKFSSTSGCVTWNCAPPQRRI